MQYEVLIDKRENKKQCTIHPLKDRADFRLRYFDRGSAPLEPFSAEVLLHVDGISLDEWPERGARQNVRSLAVVDCTWKHVEPTLNRISGALPTLVKIPPAFVTSYPRKSKQEGLDPDGGLATIEALFIAAAFLGTWDVTLLDKYHFRKEFLEWNEEAWKKFGLGPEQ